MILKTGMLFAFGYIGVEKSCKAMAQGLRKRITDKVTASDSISQPSKPSAVRRILVIKHGALGDIIQGLDAYASLRAQFTKAHITLLTSKNFASLMQTMPYFDEVQIDERAPF